MKMFGLFSANRPRMFAEAVEKLLSTVDTALILFKEGVRSYLYNDPESFSRTLSAMATTETEAAALRRDIENMLYARGALIRYRGDIMRLLERYDHILSTKRGSLDPHLDVPGLTAQERNSLAKTEDQKTARVLTAEIAQYLSPAQLEALLQRLPFFVRPGGLFLFDLRAPDYLESLDGDTFVDEDDEVFCLWRADYDKDLGALVYGMDIFSREGRLWRRSREEHIEYAHGTQQLSELFAAHGFTDFKVEEAEDRLFVSCRRSTSSVPA